MVFPNGSWCVLGRWHLGPNQHASVEELAEAIKLLHQFQAREKLRAEIF